MERDNYARENTGIRIARETGIFVAPKLLASPKSRTKKLKSSRNCYIYGEKFD